MIQENFVSIHRRFEVGGRLADYLAERLPKQNGLHIAFDGARHAPTEAPL